MAEGVVSGCWSWLDRVGTGGAMAGASAVILRRMSGISRDEGMVLVDRSGP